MKLANTKKTAEKIGCSKSKLDNDRHFGRGFPYYKIDGFVWYDLDEVLNIIKKHRIETADSRG